MFSCIGEIKQITQQALFYCISFYTNGKCKVISLYKYEMQLV